MISYYQQRTGAVRKHSRAYTMNAGMRSVCTASLLLCLTPLLIGEQQSGEDPTQPSLTVRSTLVQVPVLVKNKSGRVVFELTADEFLLTDNGVRQKTTLDADTDSQPLALAILVETAGA
jgi:hypothetical protein